MFFAAAIAAQAPSVPATVAPLSPKEEAQTFHLPPGYRVELVASEPMVIEPVAWLICPMIPTRFCCILAIAAMRLVLSP